LKRIVRDALAQSNECEQRPLISFGTSLVARAEGVDPILLVADRLQFGGASPPPKMKTTAPVSDSIPLADETSLPS